MDQVAQYYQEYGAFIKELKAERNQKVIDALHGVIIEKKNQLGRYKKHKIKKFKLILKDIDLKVKRKFYKIEEKVVEVQVVIIEKKNRFKANIIRRTNFVKTKIGKFKKKQIRKFKKVARKVEKKIEVKIIRPINRFKKNVIRKTNAAKTKVGKFKKKQIRKFKKVVRKVEKKIEVKIIRPINRFKKNVIRKTNAVKTKVGKFKKKQIRKFKKKISGVFKSSDKERQAKADGIEQIRARIEELKRYKTELLVAKTQSMELQSSGRSRGSLYIWMAAFASVLCMLILIGFGILKK